MTLLWESLAWVGLVDVRVVHRVSGVKDVGFQGLLASAVGVLLGDGLTGQKRWPCGWAAVGNQSESDIWVYYPPVARNQASSNLKGQSAMPSFKNVNAVLPVSDHATAIAWYRKWIGRGPDVEPMEGVAEWQLVDNGWIQVAYAPETAGKTSIAIGVEDIDAHLAGLAGAGVTSGEIQDYDFIKMSELVDPEGNKINFVWENPNYEPPAE
ncbi:VOC family protein [Streptomyces sp. IBSNAI002]|uniref:VOC family protein n=1 Tax=Streptomyces sp. IBSNAI002 TaxID=3457500 RepID=UPI003FD0A12F